ncbi:XkdW family protein [Fictibacillus sp. 26RED30]|uniref:XkdW family protein n=1 Tax=Fictibacillus sp. 26RED30 TaxID=2745877 RepID=UPI0018CDBCDC|nr:XkdW family protein [Fictibacillus sp. 26RED30]MBH0159890.1 hypothetical protein [Fictibacillus sp. 26RED30]
MELFKTLKWLFPDIIEREVIIQDDGNGPYIKVWNRNEVCPSIEELELTWEEIKTTPVPVFVSLEQQLEEEKLKVRRLEAQNELNNDNFIGLVQVLEEMGILS